MTVDPIYLDDLPPTLYDLTRGTWQRVGSDAAGAVIYRGVWQRRECFVKISSQNARSNGVVEYLNMSWLHGYVPLPEVLFRDNNMEYIYLVLAYVPGIPLFERTANRDQLLQVYAETLRQMHDLPVTKFAGLPEHTPDVQMTIAYDAVETRHITSEHFEGEFKGRDPEGLFDQMMHLRPQSANPAIVHGAASCDNILVQPQTGEVLALMDMSQAAIADRYTDLAVVYEEVMQRFGQDGWERFVGFYGLDEVLADKLRFYRIMHAFRS